MRATLPRLIGQASAGRIRGRIPADKRIAAAGGNGQAELLPVYHRLFIDRLSVLLRQIAARRIIDHAVFVHLPPCGEVNIHVYIKTSLILPPAAIEPADKRIARAGGRRKTEQSSFYDLPGAPARSARRIEPDGIGDFTESGEKLGIFRNIPAID